MTTKHKQLINPILAIKNLAVSVADKAILADINITVNPGEVHAIMGPNASGKSTLANILARAPGYQVTAGTINFFDKNLLALSAEECAHLGLFLSFQRPVAIPGVSNIQFLKSSINAIRKARNLKPLDTIEFLTLVKVKMRELEIPESMLQRAINDDFSGGEQKRNEILQMALLEPSLIILDEIDSGLDVDALKIVSSAINKLRSPERGILMITHYQRLLDYVKPDMVHVLADGKIIHSGDSSLPLELEKKGYRWLRESNGVEHEVQV